MVVHTVGRLMPYSTDTEIRHTKNNETFTFLIIHSSSSPPLVQSADLFMEPQISRSGDEPQIHSQHLNEHVSRNTVSRTVCIDILAMRASSCEEMRKLTREVNSSQQKPAGG